MNKFVCAALLFAVVALASLEAQEEIALKQQFALYTKKFNKVYATAAETAQRFENFNFDCASCISNTSCVWVVWDVNHSHLKTKSKFYGTNVISPFHSPHS